MLQEPLTDHLGPPGPPLLSDGALIARSIDHPSSFTAIFHRHWKRIHRFCTSRAGTHGEDIAAETFRVAFDGRARFDAAQPSAAPWLFGIATNLLRRHFRTAARGQRAVARLDAWDAGDASEDALRRVEAQQLGPELAAALATLTEAERETLLLFAWVELTYDEIAAALGIQPATVRTRIHRARTAMRAALSTTIEEQA